MFLINGDEFREAHFTSADAGIIKGEMNYVS